MYSVLLYDMHARKFRANFRYIKLVCGAVYVRENRNNVFLRDITMANDDDDDVIRVKYSGSEKKKKKKPPK